MAALNWGGGSGSRESRAAGWLKGIKFHPSVTVACYATLVYVISTAHSASVIECVGVSFYLVDITYLFQTTQVKRKILTELFILVVLQFCQLMYG